MSRDFPYYQRKLYAFLRTAECPLEDLKSSPLNGLLDTDSLELWWTNHGTLIQSIAKSSDRVSLTEKPNLSETIIETSHLISGQHQTLRDTPDSLVSKNIDWVTFLETLPNNLNLKDTFLWLWRFYPAKLAKDNGAMLLYPADRTIPDCPFHSYVSTVSAIAGAMFPDDTAVNGDRQPEHPYILLFSFSPVQDFIKASRKFLDFWAGSYLLHYLSAKLCWYLAEELGPDALIVPSLWSQEIIDAFISKKPSFEQSLKDYTKDECTPKERFDSSESNDSLVTAGFPNAITILVSESGASQIGEKLEKNLTKYWQAIAEKVRHKIHKETKKLLKDALDDTQPNSRSKRRIDTLLQGLAEVEGLTDHIDNPNRRDIKKLKDDRNWHWDTLWQEQIGHTWEPYWAAIPLGDPDDASFESSGDPAWITRQDAIAPPPPGQDTLTDAERNLYKSRINIGTWWANVQTRARHALQGIKNDRAWAIPAAPGLRSTLSGQFSAVHPFLEYDIVKDRDFRQGAGISSGSMQLFWRLMEEAFPGLFNGSEMLNALELTKRMAWEYGGVADDLGLREALEKAKKTEAVESKGEKDEEEKEDEASEKAEPTVSASEVNEANSDSSEIDYEKLIRFPNLSSIAAARFIHNQFPSQRKLVGKYWRNLRKAIAQKKDVFSARQRGRFRAKTRRLTQCPKTDAVMKQFNGIYNGTMFSSRWLADDMGLEPATLDTQNCLATLRGIVEDTHRKSGLTNGSPSDWWAIVLADGDGMGRYVAGTKLGEYGKYICQEAVDHSNLNDGDWGSLLETTKRMTPATHIGLNRALLDFSNRLVPYITEQRYCGRVVYSGGDDVMAVLPLEDLPGFLRSLRAAWCGNPDPEEQFTTTASGTGDATGYWYPKPGETTLEDRPHFTMGRDATMSAGIVIANKGIPLPTILNNLWEAEGQRAKKVSKKDGLCFRIAYSNGNVLDAVMKGELLDDWWKFVKPMRDVGSKGNVLSPLLYRLAEELPRRGCFTSDGSDLFAKATKVIANRRETNLPEHKQVKEDLAHWVSQWEKWVMDPREQEGSTHEGCDPKDLAAILRFTAFWLDKMAQRQDWQTSDSEDSSGGQAA